MSSLYDRVQESAAFLREQGAAAESLVVLGTGLGGFGDRLDEAVTIPYGEIPHFPVSTAPGHAGELIAGRRGGRPVLVMAGRFHYYEGYSLEEATFPLRVARALGAQRLLITSAVGGMNAGYAQGEIVVIEDHLALFLPSPLRGANDDRLGPRFPDMSAPYDPRMIEAAEQSAWRTGSRLPRAVLATVGGPQLETRAEYRLLRSLGADVVGMSMAPETIVAVHAGLRVCGLSVVTDLCLADVLHPVNVEEIIAVANAAAPRLETLLLDLIDHG